MIFFWGLNGWMKYAVAPGEAMEIQVTAKKWLWQFEYPDGSRTVERYSRAGEQAGEVRHDQRGRAARFLRPGHAREARHRSRPLYRSLVHARRFWERIISPAPNIAARAIPTCMAKLTVDNEADFKKWLETGGDEWKNYTPEEWGKMQREHKGCTTCHSIDGTTRPGSELERAFTAKWRR